MKKHYAALVILLMALLVVMLTTRPDAVPIYLLMVPFVLIFLAASLIVYIIARLITKRPHGNGMMTMSVFAGAITALGVGLNSVGSLLPREIAIVLLFFSLLIFYALKRRTQ